MPFRLQRRRAFVALSFALVLVTTAALAVIAGVLRVNARFGTQPISTQLRRFLSREPLAGEQDGRINVLLLGMPGRGRPGPLLTDTMVLLSVFPTLHRAALLSIPRDLSIPFPDGTLQKLNEAYRLGEEARSGQGREEARRIISETVGVEIQYVATIDFSGFSNVIDDVGGVWILVEHSFVDTRYPDGRGGWLTFKAGSRWMDGTAALQFARSRTGNNGEGSDFARSQRQQALLLALRQRLLSWRFWLNPLATYGVAADLAASVDTDLEPWQMAALGRFLVGIDIERLPAISVTDVLEPVHDDEGTFRLLPRGGSLEPLRFRVRNLLVKPALIDVQRDRPSECARAGGAIVAAERPPLVVPRAAWDLSLAPPALAPRQQVHGIVIHHDGVHYPATKTGEEKVRTLRQSVGALGWADVPYHYLIDVDGRIFEGAPEWAVTHTRTWHNPANLLQIVLLGDYSREPPSDAQLQSLIDLVEWKAAEYGLSPAQISLHSDLAATGCPGRFVHDRLTPPPWCQLVPPMN